MEVVVKFCPGCEQLLLDDVAVCPGCGQDVASSGTVPLSQSDAAEAAPDIPVKATNPNERPCPRCGASVPKTLVKCPSCRTLMQDRTLRYSGHGASAQTLRTTTAQLAGEGDFDQSSDVQLVEDPKLMSDLAGVTSYAATDSEDLDDGFEVGTDIAVRDFDSNQRYVDSSHYGSPGLVEIEEDTAEYQAQREAEYADEGGPAEYGIAGQDNSGLESPDAYDQAAYDRRVTIRLPTIKRATTNPKASPPTTVPPTTKVLMTKRLTTNPPSKPRRQNPNRPPIRCSTRRCRSRPNPVNVGGPNGSRSS
jgi:hypothetical protein